MRRDVTTAIPCLTDFAPLNIRSKSIHDCFHPRRPSFRKEKTMENKYSQTNKELLGLLDSTVNLQKIMDVIVK